MSEVNTGNGYEVKITGTAETGFEARVRLPDNAIVRNVLPFATLEAAKEWAQRRMRVE